MDKDDLPTQYLLAEEMHRWQHHYQAYKPDSCTKAIKVCEKNTFPNLDVLLQLACTIQVTSCECERSASALRRLQTYMRSSVGQSRLSSFALIHIHYDIAVDLVEKTVDLFSQMRSRTNYSHVTAVTYICVHCGSNLESRECITLLYLTITHLELCMVCL